MIVTVTNGKGGVGNTPTATTLAEWFARNGSPTLIQDFDPQGDATKIFGLPNQPDAYNLIDSGEFVATPTGRPNLDILCGDGATITLEATILNRQRVNPSTTTKTGEKMRSVAGYENIVVDTAKSGLVRESAVRAADLIIVPTTLDYSSASNTITMVDAIKQWKREHARIVILPMFADGRQAGFNLEAINTIREGAGDVEIYESAIPFVLAFKKASWDGQTVYDCAKCKKLVAAYEGFFQWLEVTK